MDKNGKRKLKTKIKFDKIDGNKEELSESDKSGPMATIQFNQMDWYGCDRTLRWMEMQNTNK